MEDLLDSWPGTLLVASHDRYFIERVTDHAVCVDRRRAPPTSLAVSRSTSRFRRDGTQAEGKAARASQADRHEQQQGERPEGRKSRCRRAAIKELAAVERRLAKIPQEIHEVNTRIAEHDSNVDYMGSCCAHRGAQQSGVQAVRTWKTRWARTDRNSWRGPPEGPARASSNAEY